GRPSPPALLTAAVFGASASSAHPAAAIRRAESFVVRIFIAISPLGPQDALFLSRAHWPVSVPTIASHIEAREGCRVQKHLRGSATRSRRSTPRGQSLPSPSAIGRHRQ